MREHKTGEGNRSRDHSVTSFLLAMPWLRIWVIEPRIKSANQQTMRRGMRLTGISHLDVPDDSRNPEACFSTAGPALYTIRLTQRWHTGRQPIYDTEAWPLDSPVNWPCERESTLTE